MPGGLSVQASRLAPRIGFVALLLALVANSAPAEEGDPEKEARAALTDFLAAWNRADNEAVRPTLNYPHLTLAGGRMLVAEGPQEFTTDFEGMRQREGWVRSTFDSIVVHRSSLDKVHCEVVYSRWRADGTAYRTASVYYIVTRKDEHWGMQFRAPVGGIARGESGERSRSIDEARQAVLDFLTAFNAADNDALLETR